MKPDPRHKKRSAIRKPKDEPLLPIDSETPPSPESIKFTFHMDNKAACSRKNTKKCTCKKGKGPRKTR